MPKSKHYIGQAGRNSKIVEAKTMPFMSNAICL